MALNLDKLKAEAKQIDEQKLSEEVQNIKLLKLSAKHKKDLINLFEKSFSGESVIQGNGGNEFSVLFGEIKISMYLVTLRPAEKNGILVPSNTVDPIFSKTKSGKKVIAIQLLDVTNYLELSENSNEYKYRYRLNEENKECKFADIESILQLIVEA